MAITVENFISLEELTRKTEGDRVAAFMGNLTEDAAIAFHFLSISQTANKTLSDSFPYSQIASFERPDLLDCCAQLVVMKRREYWRGSDFSIESKKRTKDYGNFGLCYAAAPRIVILCNK